MGTGDLPFVDEHAVEVAATPARAWDAVREVLGGTFRGRATELIARLLGAAHTHSSGDPGEAGSAFAGFVVAGADPPVELTLEGEHRFSRYALIVRIDPLAQRACRVRAETRAVFPGLRGRLYRAAVIGTGAHVLVVNRLLRAIRGRAEHPLP